MNKEDISKELTVKTRRYQKADKEYWDSILDLEMYVKRVLCDKKSIVEVSDDSINVITDKVTPELEMLIDDLKLQKIPYEYYEKNGEYYFSLGIYDYV